MKNHGDNFGHASLTPVLLASVMTFRVHSKHCKNQAMYSLMNVSRRECRGGFGAKLGIPALKGALAVLKSTCWKPGDPITRFSTSWEEAIGDPDADTEEYDETTQIDVSGGTMTPFTPEQEAEFLAWLMEHESELRRKAFE